MSWRVAMMRGTQRPREDDVQMTEAIAFAVEAIIGVVALALAAWGAILTRAEYMDASAPTALAVCKGCRSKRYCTSPCAAAEDEIAERRRAR